MPFGLCNAGSTFQRMMDRVLNGLPYVFVYLDDVLIASPDMASHFEHLRAVMQRFSENGLVLNAAKSEFCKSEIDFLGHRVSAAGITPLEKNATAVRRFPSPSTKKDLQRFLGLVNFYRRFLPSLACTIRPLTDALRGGEKTLLEWTDECEQAFVKAKNSLSEAVLLRHPVPSAPVSLAVDASATHVGAVLQQFVNGKFEPLSFFSHKLSPAEEKYSAFDRELLAGYSAIRRFRFAVEGQNLVLYTDHKPLTHALRRVSPPWSARQQRHLSYVSEFTADIRHLPGSENVPADVLSRPTVAAVRHGPPPCPMLDYKELALSQHSCADLQSMLASNKLKLSSFDVSGVPLLCEMSTGVPRPLVPTKLAHQVFLAVHSLAHPGTRATLRMVSSRFVWKGLSRDCRLWARQCVACQTSKVVRHASAPLSSMPVPTVPFSSIHIDLVGPLPLSGGCKYLFTVIDRNTRWPEAFPVTQTSASALVAVLLSEWVPRYGVPAVITSDRGAQFTSTFWASFCQQLGIKHSATTAFHPEANGLVERFHRRLKASLRARLAGADWIHHLPWVLLGLRTSPRESSNVSAAEEVFGSTLALPAQFVVDAAFPVKLHRRLQGLPPPPMQHNRVEKYALKSELAKTTFVFVRRDGHVPSLQPLYQGPYRVVERHKTHFRLQLGDKVDSVAIGRLKPANLPADTVPALPPRRGRPPKPATPACPPTPPRRRGRPKKKVASA